MIRECWENGAANQEVRELLIQMIQFGPVVDCADLAHAVSLDTAASVYDRICAVRALLACEREDRVREIANKILADPEFWPDKCVAIVAGDLFPRILTVDELTKLIGRSHGKGRSAGDFRWVSKQIVANVVPWSETAIALREALSELIWRNRKQSADILRFEGTHDYLAPALATLCERQLTESPGHIGLHGRGQEIKADLVRSCVVAALFGSDVLDGRGTVKKLRRHFKEDPALRCTAFEATLTLTNKTAPNQSDWRRFLFVRRESLAGDLGEVDRPWLEKTLLDQDRPERRGAALHVLLVFWRCRGRLASELNEIRAMLKGDKTLGQILEQHATPPEHDDETERKEREQQRWQRDRDREEEERQQHCTKWREKLRADPDNAFSPANRCTTLWKLYEWLDDRHHIGTSYFIWNTQLLVEKFGVEIANAAENALREHWRHTPPVPWSARPAAERSSIESDWILGLFGVSAEFQAQGWIARLTSDEARLATAYATMELGGFPPFLSELAQSYPTEVSEVIGEEVSAELGLGACYEHLPTLEKLAYAESSLKQLVIPRLICELKEWPHSIAEGRERHWPKHLCYVLRILEETESETDRETITRECEKRYRANPDGMSALAWLQGLFRFDAVRGAQALSEEFANREDAGTCERAIETFAALFGDHDTAALEIADPDQRARVLGQLVRQACAFVRPEDDQVHESASSPDTRDNAESARNFLLSSLIDTPGPKAWQILRELAEEDGFARSRVRLRFHAWERAATDAEFAPYEPKDVAELDTRLEMPPADRDGLLAVMTDRFEDLAHDLEHHDFSIRETLKGIEDEPEMQRILAWSLEKKTNGVYRVTREEEVAERKRTDIRLLSTVSEQKAAIEVKIADHWSVNKLERALKDQLVGQYLRHVNCKAGCLLLTYRGKKKHWIRPGTKGKRMAFGDVVLMLEETARNLEDRNPDDFRIAVFGLDLTGP